MNSPLDRLARVCNRLAQRIAEGAPAEELATLAQAQANALQVLTGWIEELKWELTNARHAEHMHGRTADGGQLTATIPSAVGTRRARAGNTRLGWSCRPFLLSSPRPVQRRPAARDRSP